MALRQRAGQRFARLATDTVVRWPRLWRIFRRPLRREFDQIATFWDRGRDRAHLASYEAALDAVEALPKRALDIGTGTGAGAFAIARRFPQAEVIGVDIAPAMLEEARKKVPPELADRVSFQAGDASKLPFADGSFELVGLANMIPFFDEIERIVAPGGSVVFGWSVGPQTPIYVPSERLRSELARRGFSDFAEFEAARGTGFLARKGGSR